MAQASVTARASGAVRPARPEDVPLLLALVQELAEYERAADQVTMSAEDLSTALFGDPPSASCLAAEVGAEVVGLALYFRTFSTWTGRPGIWLEDLYVRPSFRGLGLGRSLVAALAGLAVETGCERLEWSVLDWNTPAWEFYAALGARPMSEWTTHRVAGEALRTLACGDRATSAR